MTESRQNEMFQNFPRDSGVRSKCNTVQSTDGLLTVQGNYRIARKPGQSKWVKAVCTRQTECNVPFHRNKFLVCSLIFIISDDW